MLSIFPALFDFSFLGIFVIRIALAISIFSFCVQIFKERVRLVAVFEKNKIPQADFLVWFWLVIFFVVGVMLTIGIYTQIALLALAFFMLKLAIINHTRFKVFDHSTLFYVVLFLISLATLFLGPGAFAFDLPI